MSLKKGLFYFFYTLAAFIFFAIALFPEKEAARILSQRVENLHKGVHLTMEGVNPVFPLGVCIREPMIQVENGPLIFLDSLRIKLNMGSFPALRKKIAFTAMAYEGELSGSLSFPLDNFQEDLELQGNFSHLNFKDITLSSSQGNILVSLILEGDCLVKSQRKSHGTLIATGIQLGMEDTLLGQLGLSRLIFDKADLKWEFEKKRLSITNFKAKGPDLVVEMTGSIMVNRQSEKSLLNLEGTMRPDPALVSKFSTIASMAALFQTVSSSGIPFKLTGTPENPKFSL